MDQMRKERLPRPPRLYDGVDPVHSAYDGIHGKEGDQRHENVYPERKGEITGAFGSEPGEEYSLVEAPEELRVPHGEHRSPRGVHAYKYGEHDRKIDRGEKFPDLHHLYLFIEPFDYILHEAPVVRLFHEEVHEGRVVGYDRDPAEAPFRHHGHGERLFRLVLAARPVAVVVGP